MNAAPFASSPVNVALLGTSSSGTAGATLYFKFSTRNTSGVPTTLAGTPVVSIYKNASTTQSTAGVTLAVDFDAVTGLNHVSVDTSADATFYANGSHFDLVITAGTVGGVSVVGEVVGSFELAAASTPAAVAAAVWDEVLTGATHNIQNSAGKLLRTIAPTSDAIYNGTLPSQAGMTSTQVKLDAGASASDDVYNDTVISILTGTGAGQSRIVTDYVGSTRVATVSSAWTVPPAAAATFELSPMTTVLVSGPVTVGTMGAGVITAASIAAGALSGKGDWLTGLGATAPAGWITSTVVAPSALVGKGDWLTTADSRLNYLDASIASRSTYSGGPVAGVTAPIILPAIPTGWITSTGIAAGALAGKGDWSTHTAAQAADKLIGRSIEGGADGGRTVAQALAFLRNKWEIAGGTLIVYAADDTATLWTAAVSTTAGNPVTEIDPG